LAHNLKAAGSNPAPATKNANKYNDFKAELNARLFAVPKRVNNRSTKQGKTATGEMKGLCINLATVFT
jgi:hypothetical protein